MKTKLFLTVLFLTAYFNLSNAPVNTVPTAQSVAEDTAIVLNGVSVSDVDGNLSSVTISVNNGVLGVSIAGSATVLGNNSMNITVSGSESDINATIANITYNPNPDYNGSDVFTISSTDSSSSPLTDTDTINITIIPVNDAPVCVSEAKATLEDIALAVSATNGLLVNDTDIDGDALTVTSLSVFGTTFTVGTSVTAIGTGVSSLTINADGSYAFTPEPNFSGVIPQISYTISDGVSSTSCTLDITVIPVNDAPICTSDVNSTPINTMLTESAASGLLANDTDVDGDVLVVSGLTIYGTSFNVGTNVTLTGAGIGSLIINADGSYTFTPESNFSGAIPQITYTITDGTVTSTCTFDITVNTPSSLTYVPDNNLETYLETHDANGNVVPFGDPASMGNGTGTALVLDNYVFTNRINMVKKLEVPSLSIALMTGIQDFAALEHLNCFDNNIGNLDLSSNTNLNYVKCDSNQITSLDVSNSPNLNFLACNVNQLPSLDVTQNSNLTILDCDTNQITNLDVTNNPVLHTLDAQGNLLTSLNTSQNPLLFTLVCSSNQIPSLDVTNNTKLNALNCSDNLLTSLNLNLNLDLQILGLSKNSISTIDLSNNLKLEIVAMAENLFTQIDVKLNTALHNFTANDNPNLKNLNIANGNNASFTFLQIVNNPLLTCVIADAATPATGLTGWNKDNQHMFSVACTAQQLTYVPDDNLELYLETHDANGNPVTMGDPTSMGNATSASDPLDDYVFTNRINTVAILRVNGLTISDMTGIEDFVSLQVLDAHNNNFSTIDVSSLSSLYQLAIGSNPINMLDVSANSNLRILEVNSTGLTNLDVTSNAVLEFLKIDDTSLTSIDTSQNPNLKTLSTENTPLTQVDLTNNTLLEFLELRDNALTGLDISNNLQLISFVLTGSPVTSLDLSQHDKLIEVRVNNNVSLAQLNIKNGANTNIATSSFDIINNPNLICIEVDSVTYSDANWTSKDAQHVYNTTCGSQQITLIPDPVFEQILINFNIDSDGVVNGQVFTSDIEYVGTLYLYCTSNCSSSTTPKITDLTGIEDFTSLIILEAGNNSIAGSLNLSNNTNLTHIRVQNNLITNLILGNNSNLKEIRAQGNNISAIDVSGNVNLEQINLDSNSLSTINLDQNTNLTKLYLNNNMLTTLDITNNNLLDNLHINNNQITSVDLTNKLNLSSFRAENNLLSGKIDFSNNTKLVDVHLNNNQLNTLDLSASVGLRLEEIRVANNSLVSLNLDNGYSQSSGPISFDTRNNLNLKCIQVPDVSLYQWVTDIDPHTSFNTDCSTVWSVMTNPATTTALLAIPGLDDGDGIITIAEAAAFTGDTNGELNLSSTGITDVEGLAAFTSILKLDVSGNGITDLSPLTGSSFTTIAKSTGKTKIVQKTTTMALQTLIASNNNFDVLDVSSLSNLTAIDVSNNPNLVTLNMQNGNNASITSFDATNTPNLSCILVDDVNANYLSTWLKATKSEFVADATECRAKVLSLNVLDLDTNIVFYPNPVNNILNIKISDALNLQEVNVYSMSGKSIMKSKKTSLDFSKLSNGFYLVKIITDKGVSTKRIIKK